MLLPDGPCPRFGSCYFLLKPEVLRRSTFSYMDSHRNPPEKGTLDAFDDILAALLAESFERDFALGITSIRPKKLIDHLKSSIGKPFDDPSPRLPDRNLDYYIEAQVHGAIHLRDDVDILVADPSFKGTDTGTSLERICKVFDIDLYWHCGFMMSVFFKSLKCFGTCW